MTVRAQRTRLLPEDRRAQLIGHAVASFADHGIARATQSHVAARAGVSLSTVYFYFRTREDLVDAVLEAVETYLITMVAQAVDSQAPLYKALWDLAIHTAETARVDPDFVRVWLDWSTGVRAKVWPRYLVLQDRLQAMVGTLFTRIGPDEASRTDLENKSAARLFVGGAHTLALMQFAGVSGDELDIFIDQMVRGVMGIGREEATTAYLAINAAIR